MKPFAVGLLVAFSLAALLRDAQATDELVVEAGRDLAVTVGFPIGEGANTNPAVVQASVDPAHGRITLSGKKPGTATYVAFDARSRTHSVEYHVRVIAAKPHLPLPQKLAATAGDETVRIAVGGSVKMKIPFAIGSGANSNPGALSATADASDASIELSGRAPGIARYEVVDAGDAGHRLAYRVEILAKE